MSRSTAGRIICLSNVFDEQYQGVRGEEVHLPLSSPKRRDLFRCLAQASGREVVLLSSPPKPLQRRSLRWLPPADCRFSDHLQRVCGNLDGPKIRIPASWIFYAAHVVRQVRSGDLVLLDNYELIYVLAAHAARLGRKPRFILDYEDGKHVIDRGWARWLSGAAEWLGRPLLSGALLAHPALAQRLPSDLPQVLVPGFFLAPQTSAETKTPSDRLRFLYTGSLDRTRGVDLLLDALPLLPADGWELHLTGAGPLEATVRTFAEEIRWAGRVYFHGTLPKDAYERLLSSADVALNCQRPSDPISDVTYPSKTFSYLSAGLRLLSSTASRVPEVLGEAAWYFPEETPASLAAAMTRVLREGLGPPPTEALRLLASRYSTEGTVGRLKAFLDSLR